MERDNGARGAVKAASGSRRRKAAPQPGPISRENILNEAARLFLELGFRRTRMQDIAAAFNVTHAAIYYYFPRKSDILYELNLSGLGELMKGATDAEHETNSAAERFHLQLLRHIQFVADKLPQAASCFLFEEGMPADQLRTVQKLRRNYTDVLIDSFATAQRDGAFRSEVDPRTAVDTLLGAANWMYRWLKPSRGGNQDLAKVMGDMLAYGFVDRNR